METKYLIVGSGILLLLTVVFFLFRKRYKYRSCKEKLERKIKNGISLPIEIFEGHWRVYRKTTKETLLLIRIYNGRLIKNMILEAKVPSRMFIRITEGHTYYFSYNQKDHLLHFDSDIVHTEPSDLLEEDMKKVCFPMKSKILDGLVR